MDGDGASRSGPPGGWIASALLGAAAFAWGLAMAPRGYAEGDASELTLVLAVGGVPHPTGYPLYALAGHVFVRLLHAAGASWPVAANTWSAVGGAVAALFLARLGIDLAADRTAVSPRGATRLLLPLLPLLLFLAQPIWSLAATQAEVTSWHGAWVALAAWSAWRLAAGPPRAAARSALLWGLVVGAGLAHHATSLLVSLPLTAWLATAGRGRGVAPRAIAPRFLAGLAVPLVALGWIAYRASWPAPYQWPLLTPGLDGLLAHATGGPFGGYLGGFRPTEAEAGLLGTAAPWLALSVPALAAAALSRGATPRRSFARALGAAAALQTAFLLAYRVPDPSWLAIPILLLAAAWLPRAIVSLAARAGSAAPALLLAGAAIALLPWWIGRDLAARRSAERTDRIVRAAWEQVPFERGLVIWNNDLLPRLRAYQLLEGRHPARAVEHPGMLTWDPPRRAFRERLGFDPWGGAIPEREEELIPRLRRAASEAGLPAVDFDDVVRRAGG